MQRTHLLSSHTKTYMCTQGFNVNHIIIVTQDVLMVATMRHHVCDSLLAHHWRSLSKCKTCHFLWSLGGALIMTYYWHVVFKQRLSTNMQSLMCNRQNTLKLWAFFVSWLINHKGCQATATLLNPNKSFWELFIKKVQRKLKWNFKFVW